LASCGYDITTRLWDIASGRELVRMPGYRRLIRLEGIQRDSRLRLDRSET
jgi:hypothetical protein